MKVRMPLFLVTCLSLIATHATATDRSDEVRAAQRLQITAEKLAKLARLQCGCRHTAESLDRIADEAMEIELAIRFDDQDDLEEHTKQLLREIKKMRPYLNNVPSTQRRHIKKTLLIAVNDMGQQVFQGQWVHPVCAPGAPTNDTQANNAVQPLSELQGLIQDAVSTLDDQDENGND